MEKQRFYARRTLGGARTICDRKDDSLVAIVTGGSRPTEHTEAMIAVMLKALNEAVEKNGTRQA